MSRYFLCDYCEHAKKLNVFNVECDKYGVTAKRIMSDDQYSCEVCDCYMQACELLGGDAE